jgi:hypothetical protein
VKSEPFPNNAIIRNENIYNCRIHPYIYLSILLPCENTKRGKKGRGRQIEGARSWWLTPVILATWEVEIERIGIQVQPGKVKPFLNH